MEEPIIRQLYVHFTGKIIIVIGIAQHYKDNTKQVIYSSIDDNILRTIPLSEFFTPHPTTKIPRYRLVRPESIVTK